MSAIERCRTAALGGHVEQCDECGHQRICYRLVAAIGIALNASPWPAPQWLEDRQAELLIPNTSTSSLRCPKQIRRDRLPE